MLHILIGADDVIRTMHHEEEEPNLNNANAPKRARIEIENGHLCEYWTPGQRNTVYEVAS